ncbi:MAG TPA: hypothetical protein VN933_16225 [Candidatus Eremiobacteraceae bacterium]|nr:hypothetical protein [Candidatus Eremiobacteraceae bacterium]
MGRDDAGKRPAADEAACPALVAAGELAAATEGEFVDKTDDADVADVEGGEAFVGGEIEWIRNEAGCVVGGGLVYGVAVVESFGEGVRAAERQAVTEAAANVDLQAVKGADSFGEPSPSVGEGGVGFLRVSRNVISARGNGRSGERRADGEADIGAVGGGGGESRVPSWENGGAWIGRADDAFGLVGVKST